MQTAFSLDISLEHIFNGFSRCCVFLLRCCLETRTNETENARRMRRPKWKIHFIFKCSLFSLMLAFVCFRYISYVWVNSVMMVSRPNGHQIHISMKKSLRALSPASDLYNASAAHPLFTCRTTTIPKAIHLLSRANKIHFCHLFHIFRSMLSEIYQQHSIDTPASVNTSIACIGWQVCASWIQHSLSD